MSLPIYIFDIDGTIADTSRRLHLIKPPKGEKKDWGKFFRESESDEPFRHMQYLYESLKFTRTSCFYFITARPENNRTITEEWLKTHGFTGYNHLFMRPDTERKPDFEVKRDIYKKHFEPVKDRIMGVFEDRLHVAKMWREEGLPVFLCGDHWIEGDWSK